MVPAGYDSKIVCVIVGIYEVFISRDANTNHEKTKPNQAKLVQHSLTHSLTKNIHRTVTNKPLPIWTITIDEPTSLPIHFLRSTCPRIIPPSSSAERHCSSTAHLWHGQGRQDTYRIIDKKKRGEKRKKEKPSLIIYPEGESRQRSAKGCDAGVCLQRSAKAPGEAARIAHKY